MVQLSVGRCITLMWIASKTTLGGLLRPWHIGYLTALRQHCEKTNPTILQWFAVNEGTINDRGSIHRYQPWRESNMSRSMLSKWSARHWSKYSTLQISYMRVHRQNSTNFSFIVAFDCVCRDPPGWGLSYWEGGLRFSAFSHSPSLCLKWSLVSVQIDFVIVFILWSLILEMTLTCRNVS